MHIRDRTRIGSLSDPLISSFPGKSGDSGAIRRKSENGQDKNRPRFSIPHLEASWPLAFDKLLPPAGHLPQTRAKPAAPRAFEPTLAGPEG